MKKLLIILLALSLFSCEVNQDIKKITYRISENEAGFLVTYLNENGVLIKENIVNSSSEDVWSYCFDAVEGDIIYVSANYKDISDGMRIEILVDGKVYKQSESLFDTLNYITVSGTVPYE